MQKQIELFDVQSAQVFAIGHCSETNTLAIRFTKGYGANRGPGSLGKHFGQYIKPFPNKYPYHKVAEEQRAA